MTNTPKAQINNSKFGHRFLWSKQSSANSPPKNGRSMTQTETISASSVFKNGPIESTQSLSDQIQQTVNNGQQKTLNWLKTCTDSLSSKILGFRPIEFWLELRPEYCTLSLLSNGNSVRLSMVALSNIISAAPKEDQFGVTQAALPKIIRVLNNIIKGLDRLCRNNQQRSELRKLRNEARTSLGKICAAYGQSLEELNFEK